MFVYCCCQYINAVDDVEKWIEKRNNKKHTCLKNENFIADMKPTYGHHSAMCKEKNEWQKLEEEDIEGKKKTTICVDKHTDPNTCHISHVIFNAIWTMLLYLDQSYLCSHWERVPYHFHFDMKRKNNWSSSEIRRPIMFQTNWLIITSPLCHDHLRNSVECATHTGKHTYIYTHVIIFTKHNATLNHQTEQHKSLYEIHISKLSINIWWKLQFGQTLTHMCTYMLTLIYDKKTKRREENTIKTGTR